MQGAGCRDYVYNDKVEVTTTGTVGSSSISNMRVRVRVIARE